MKVRIKDDLLFNKLYDEFHKSNYEWFNTWLLDCHNVKITDSNNPSWTDEYYLFDSQEDYFLFLIKVSS